MFTHTIQSQARKMLIGLVGALSLCGMNVQAGTIVYGIESPIEGGTYAGIANLRGWAVSSVGIARVELYINGVYKTEIPMGASRADVGGNYPSYPNSSMSGFAMAYNYGNRTPGTNQVTYKIVDNSGASESVTRTINTIQYANDSYLSATETVSYTGAGVSASGHQINITNMKIKGMPYDATLTFDTESQQFVFTRLQ